MNVTKWLFGLLVLSTTVQAEGLTGTYSSLFYHEEAGDLLGIEILILPAATTGSDFKYNAVVQIAEGGAPDVFVIPLKELDSASFVLELPSGTKLIAKRELEGLTITWPHGDVDELKKGQSYWR